MSDLCYTRVSGYTYVFFPSQYFTELYTSYSPSTTLSSKKIQIVSFIYGVGPVTDQSVNFVVEAGDFSPRVSF